MSKTATPICTEELTAGTLAQYRRSLVHQFKNDLSLLSSVVRLNAAHADSDPAAEALYRIERRIQALTCFYKHPCDGRAIESVGILTVLSRILDTVLLPDQMDKKLHYLVQSDVHDTLLSREIAQPLLLLIHELVSDYFVKGCRQEDPLECILEHRRTELFISLQRRHPAAESSQYHPSTIVQAFTIQLDATLEEMSDRHVRAIMIRCQVD